MESLVYFFGKDKEAYYQYPTDYTEDFFKKGLADARNKAQIAIHRDGNLLFYNYIRKLDNKEERLGICIATDYIFLDYQNLFETLETFFALLAESGTIVKFDNRGQIIIKSKPFSEEKVFLDDLSKEIVAYATEIPKNKRRKLPLQNYSISKDDCKELSLEDGNTKIALALEDYSNVYLSTTRLEIERITSFGAQIREKEERIKQLETENAKIIKQKKQVTKVVILIIALLICLIGLWIFGNNVQNQKAKIEEQNEIISDKQAKLDGEIEKTKTLQSENAEYLAKINELKTYRFIIGSNERKEELSNDNGWVEWIDVKMPLEIKSFYTNPSSCGSVTISAYNTKHEKIASSIVEISNTGWQKIELSNFIISSKGKYYLCLEDTSIKLVYHSSKESEYTLYKHGVLQVIGATSKNDAEKDNTSIGTGYYQYFYSIEYSLL